MKIKLQAVIDAIEQATDSYTSFYDTKTNETVYLPDAFITGETDEKLVELLENEPDRFLGFPTKYDIHEYSIMEAFADYLPPGKLWYDYLANAYREIAERWCRDNEIEFE